MRIEPSINNKLKVEGNREDLAVVCRLYQKMNSAKGQQLRDVLTSMKLWTEKSLFVLCLDDYLRKLSLPVSCSDKQR